MLIEVGNQGEIFGQQRHTLCFSFQDTERELLSRGVNREQARLVVRKLVNGHTIVSVGVRGRSCVIDVRAS